MNQPIKIEKRKHYISRCYECGKLIGKGYKIGTFKLCKECAELYTLN